MTKTQLFFVSIFVLGFIFLFKPTGEKSVLNYETFQTSSGWGYNILEHRHILIHQETIPGEETLLGFATQNQAAKTAELVMKKLHAGDMPSITKKEMEIIKNHRN